MTSVLRDLLVPGRPLVLPNAWDAASARAVVAAGFPVVATASAAVSEVLGYADGEGTPPAEMFAAIGRIARAVDVPVTADLEHGYGLAPRELVERLAAAGAVGDPEDSDPRTEQLVDAAEQADYLAAVRGAATDLGVDLVINARTDTFEYGEGSRADRIAEAVRRAAAYIAAGADGIYPILFSEPADVRALVEQIAAPVNVYARLDGPSVGELAALGVGRISYGPGLHGAAMDRVAEVLARLRG